MKKHDTVSPSMAAVHIVCADLILAGYKATIASELIYYDVILDANGRLFRVQVKGTMGLTRRSDRGEHQYRYRFLTSRNHRPEIHGEKADVRKYTDADADIMACVAIDLRCVAYFKIADKFVHGLELYAPGTPSYPRNGVEQRRMIDAFPIDHVLRGLR